MDRVDGWKSVGRTQDKWKATSVSCGSWLLVSVFITWQRAIVCVRVVSYCWYHSLGRGRCDSGFTWVSKGAKHCQNRISVLNYLSRTVCRRKYRSRLPPPPHKIFSPRQEISLRVSEVPCIHIHTHNVNHLRKNDVMLTFHTFSREFFHRSKWKHILLVHQRAKQKQRIMRQTNYSSFCWFVFSMDGIWVFA